MRRRKAAERQAARAIPAQGNKSRRAQRSRIASYLGLIELGLCGQRKRLSAGGRHEAIRHMGRHGESRRVFERVVEARIAAVLVGGISFSFDASLIRNPALVVLPYDLRRSQRRTPIPRITISTAIAANNAKLSVPMSSGVVPTLGAVAVVSTG
jgi:hypothetical protein